MTLDEIKAAHREDLRIIDEVLSEAARRWRMPKSYKMPKALGPELAMPLSQEPATPTVQAEAVEDTEQARADAQAAWDADLVKIGEYLSKRAVDARFCFMFDAIIKRIDSRITGHIELDRGTARSLRAGAVAAAAAGAKPRLFPWMNASPDG